MSLESGQRCSMEELKKRNPIEWVRRVNGIRSRVEEIVFCNILK